MTDHDWLTVHRGQAPLVIGLPHTGTEIPQDLVAGMVSPWRARKDADWWVDRLYAFAVEMDVTLVRTAISRSVIDVNRDPSGASLYPGMTTTGLCPTETFDGEPLYRPGREPDAAEIDRRRTAFFAPYHDALTAELDRLRLDGPVVLYDAHSIRSVVPRLFEGELPQFNIGDNGGLTCDPALTAAIEAACAASGLSHVVNGRFRGGWTTRRYGRPAEGLHAVQMELADRGYMDDPSSLIDETNWPSPWDPEQAATLQVHLRTALTACLDFAQAQRNAP